MSKQRREQTTSAEAEAAVALLEEKIRRHRDRAAELVAARKSSAYAARVLLDVEQSKILDGIIDESSKHALEGNALLDALDEAKRRLEQARQDEAHKADKQAAQALRRVLAEFVAQGEQLDAALATIAETGVEIRETLSRMHGLGSGFPSHQQLDVLGSLCLRTALQKTPWDRHFERLAPNQRRSFGDLVRQWSATVEHQISARLGEQTNEAA